MAESLVDELLRQPDLEASQATLEARADEIDRDDLGQLGALGQQLLEESRLPEAASVFAKAELAAALAGESEIQAMFAVGTAQALHELGHKDAEQMLEYARRLSDAQLGTGNETIDAGFVGVSLRLADLLDERGETARARRLLAHTRRRCREIGDRRGELWAVQGLLRACLTLHDLRPATGYAEILARGLDESDEQAPDPRTVYALLLQVAHAYYYDEDEFERAAEIAALAAAVLPDESAAHVLRGHAFAQLKRFDESAAEYGAALARPPVDAGVHANYAAALANLGRAEEALAAADDAVSLAPDQARYRLSRGQINEHLDRIDEALADYGAAIELGRAQPETPEPEEAARSDAAYMRSLSGRDLADFAQVARLSLLRRLGRTDEARADVDELIRDGDLGARYGGYVAAAEMDAEGGRPEDALAAYGEAIELVDNGSARIGRADLYLSLGRLDEALDDLVFAADKNRRPDEALERLDQLVEQHPDDTRLLKWRGYANLESWRPVSAEHDLNTALERLGDDPDIYLWRGLSRIMISPHPGERSLEEPLTAELVTGAIQDLARAARLGADGALDAYLWLVDRVTTDDGLLWWVWGQADEEDGLFSLVKGGREAWEALSAGFDLEAERRWDEAVERYHVAQTALAAANLPVSALRVHMRLADNYVRLGALQVALDHLAELDRNYLRLHTRPLTQALQPQADEQAEQAWRATGGDAATMELEYAAVYPIGSIWFLAIKRILEAEATSRVGDPAKAVEIIGDVEELRQAGALSIRTLISLATIFRDAQQYERATELLAEGEDLAEEPYDKARLYNTAATIFQLTGQDELALRSLAAAEAVAREANFFAPPLAMNGANVLLQLGQPQEALDRLDEIDPETDFRTLRDRYQYSTLRAQILRRLGRSDEALAGVREAVALADQEREGLRGLDLRMSLQSRHATIYELGVEIAAEAGDAALAFELVEKSRSRAFIDQLAAGKLPLSAETEELVGIERNLAELHSVLLRLNASLTEWGPDYVDYELVDAAEELDSGLELVAQENGQARISAEGLASALHITEQRLAGLRSRIDDERRSQAVVTAGELVSLNDVRAFLSG